MTKPPFINGEIYHIYNRGVDKRDIFLEDKDYLRFIHDLFEFNDTEPAPAANVRFLLRKPSELTAPSLFQCLEVQPPNIGKERRKRKLLVEILAFCLMPNHYHLLLRQKTENGIVQFMQKIGTGYTMYFNQKNPKNKRVGALFQGRFKAVALRQEGHFLSLPNYIHLNPLDISSYEWRERKIKDSKQALDFLENYRWSSFMDYIGKKNFPSVTQREFLLEILGEPRKYKKDIRNWLAEMDTNSIESALLLE
ncbi:MAG: transposase [Parcubacteria group bacterium]|nr:transposase [Parcubacteria group bacterium]